MLSRRTFFSSLAAGIVGLGAYACGFEPLYRLVVTRYDLPLPRWPKDAKPLKIALVADIHAVEPWMSLPRIREIVDATNALAPDMTLLLGDFMGAIRFRSRLIAPDEWARELERLRAPLGSYAILGNHDYRWNHSSGPIPSALAAIGIPLLANEARRITAHGHDFWLTGTESILTGPDYDFPAGPGLIGGRDNLAVALAGTDASAPIIHMAHEPDMFASMPDHVALTVSGHTHGGQVWLPFFGRPLVRSLTGLDLEYGHIEQDGKHIVVSGGLGCSHLPIRLGVPPEIVLLTVRSA